VDVNQLLEAWRTNNRITLFLLDEISDEGLSCTLSRRGGRDVARQFAHLHDVRLYHLGERASDLAQGLERFQEKGRPAVSPDRETLKAALTESGEAIEAFLRDVAEGSDAGLRRRGFKKGVVTTLAYFIAHESHHLGSILLTLKQCGHAVDRSSAYRIWDWDRM
jgi:uncharacterized damage-inducible protein DinB